MKATTSKVAWIRNNDASQQSSEEWYVNYRIAYFLEPVLYYPADNGEEL